MQCNALLFELCSRGTIQRGSNYKVCQTVVDVGLLIATLASVANQSSLVSDVVRYRNRTSLSRTASVETKSVVYFNGLESKAAWVVKVGGGSGENYMRLRAGARIRLTGWHLQTGQ